MKKGSKHTDKAKQKNRNKHFGKVAWNKGIKRWWKTFGEFKKGCVPWNKGKKCPQISRGLTGRKRSSESRKKQSEKLIGKKWGHHSIESRKKIGNKQKGVNNHNWHGGITPENHKIRMSIEWSLWREATFARDNWTCQKCKVKSGELRPHHIKNFSQYPELRFAIDNGITFCNEHHKEFHKIYGNVDNNKQQLIAYLYGKHPV